MNALSFSFILRISTFFIFFGRAWQHLFWDAPYRSFFWDEALLKPVVEKFTNSSWQEYATSPMVDLFVQKLVLANGILYVIAAIAVVFIKPKNRRWTQFPIALGGITLIILSVLMAKEKFYHIAQFLEHSIQFATPFALLMSYRKNGNNDRLIMFLKILVAVTFCSHGLYAIGVYPVPGNFVDLVINILGVSEKQALLFLYVVGILDIGIAIFIFFPKTEKTTICYAIIWGFLTAFARIIANIEMDFIFSALHQNLYQVLYRLSHGLIPFAILISIKETAKKSKRANSTIESIKY